MAEILTSMRLSCHRIFILQNNKNNTYIQGTDALFMYLTCAGYHGDTKMNGKSLDLIA